ncbi:MAG: hypothetical protein JWP91_2962 [Fibrobacteres bacterium]|nr:hypothetical protein [Fibrobacterota bacterium]
MKTRFVLITLFLFHFSFSQDPPQFGTPFAGVPDPRDGSIYQVNIRAFSEAGNFQGVTNRLDQIRALGVNILYLMPCTPVGILKTANSPYCVRNYKEVNPEFGTLADLRTLIAEAHKRGMAVILDWVANHTAWDHPWITEHPSWYMKDAGGAIVPAKVGGFVWNDVAQLDFSNKDMRQGMVDAMRYWIFAANADGFRCDYTDGPPVDFWVETNANLRAIPGRKFILYAEGGRTANYKAFDYNHGFSFYDGLKQMFGPAQMTALKVESENDAQYQGAGESNRLVRYITNHDVNGWDGPPATVMGGQAGSMAAFVLAAYNKGVPLIYNGQEIALDYALTFPFTDKNVVWNENKAVTDEYIKLIRFRNASEAIRRGTLASYSNGNVSAFVKKTDKEKVVVLVNVRNRQVQYPLPPDLANATWYNGFDKSVIKTGASMDLGPYQYVVATAAPLEPSGIDGRSPEGEAPGITARYGNRILTLAGMAPGCAIRVSDASGKTLSSMRPRDASARIDLGGSGPGLLLLTIEDPGTGRLHALKFMR